MQEAFVSANGQMFRVVSAGPDGAQLVLMLHGFPETAHSWRYQVPALARSGRRVWTPDLRGYNRNSKPRDLEAFHPDVLCLDVEELLNAAEAEKAVIVGHDWGGIMAWWFAMDYPERVSRLVVMNAPHPAMWKRAFRMPHQLMRSTYVGLFQIPLLPERFLSANAKRVAQSIRTTAVRKEALRAADIAIYAEAIAQPGAMRSAVHYYRALMRWGMWRPVKRINAPTLMIWGEHDLALSKGLTYGTDRHVRDFRIHYIPRCGHWVQQEAAAQVNDLLMEFLSGG
jgi:pimeloyl-ACP methyl ester carboxylesterase